jgi:hypothetical protein
MELLVQVQQSASCEALLLWIPQGLILLLSNALHEVM